MGLMKNMLNSIKKFFNLELTEKEQKEIPQESLRFANNIALWKSIYSGCAKWIDYTISTIDKKNVKKRMKQVNGAKIVSKGITQLLWAENPVINADQSILDDLTRNDFYDVMSQKIEYMCALGGIVLKPFLNAQGEVEIDYFNADKFIPISWNSSTIIEADFLDYISAKGKNYVRIESHRLDTYEDLDEKGNVVSSGAKGYLVTNKLYLITDGKRRPVNLNTIPSLIGIEEEVPIDSLEPQFIYIKMPEANNLNLESPLGISLFANSVDTLEMIDVCWNALNSEIVLGKKRIIVPAAALKTVATATGIKRYFDPNDEAIVAFDFDDDENLKVQDNTVEIRTEEIVGALKAMLSILSLQCGFDSGFLTFDGVAVKTATEIVSEKSETFVTMKLVRNSVDKGIKKLIKLMDQLKGKDSKDVTITWDDSIIEDRQTDYIYYAGMVSSGFMSKLQAIMNLNGLDEAAAKKEIAQIDSEKITIVNNSMGSEDE